MCSTGADSQPNRSPPARPTPGAYSDYRAYLRDLVVYLRATQRHFSYANVSRRAGFRSLNYLRLVIDGKRHLSRDSLRRFSDALKLEADEQHAFEALVNLTLAATEAERERYLRQLAKPTERMATVVEFPLMYLTKKELVVLEQRLLVCAQQLVAEIGESTEGARVPVQLALCQAARGIDHNANS